MKGGFFLYYFSCRNKNSCLHRKKGDGMTVLVEAKNMEVTESLRQHVIKQAQKLSKIGKRVVGVRVFLETVAKKSNDPHANYVTFQVMIPGKDVVVRKQAADMYEAIVQAARSSVRYVRKLAERRLTRSRHANNKVPVIQESAPNLSF